MSCAPALRRPWMGFSAALLAIGFAVFLSGCAATGQASDANTIGPAAGHAPPRTNGPDPLTYHPKRNDLALFALSLLDAPYVWGGRGPATGFDCSGLVSYVYREAAGLPVKGSSADLGKKSRPIDRTHLQPGDLVFFNTLGTRHSHVGIYVGDGRFVHASNPRTGVRVDQLTNRYFAQRFEGAGTLLD